MPEARAPREERGRNLHHPLPAPRLLLPLLLLLHTPQQILNRPERLPLALPLARTDGAVLECQQRVERSNLIPLLLERVDDLLEMFRKDVPLGDVGGAIHEGVLGGELDVDTIKRRSKHEGSG